MFISMQKINFIAYYFLETLQRYCIVVILSTLGMPSDMTVPTFWILWSLSLQKSTLLLLLSRDTAKILQTCYFKYFGQDLPYSPILIISTCRKVCLSACKKSTSCLPFIFSFNSDSLHARLNSLSEAWIYKKKKHKKDYSLQEICLAKTYT